jgi:hypothetical protein
LVEKGNLHALTENLEKFKGLDHQKIAEKLFEHRK